MKKPVVGFVGNPNTGKSTLFNALCGTRQSTGNYPGVTVEKKTGEAMLPDGPVELIDLPGIYSLKAISPDEEVTADCIMGRMEGQRRPDLIVFILDATNLKRNLYLFSQVAELERPLVVVLTMTDLLERENIKIDLDNLQRHLGVPMVPVVAREKDSLDAFRVVLQQYLHTGVTPDFRLPYPPDLESIVEELQRDLSAIGPISRLEARDLIFFKRDPLRHYFEKHPEALARIEAARELAGRRSYRNPSLLALERYRWAERVVSEVEERPAMERVTFSDRLDGFLTHRLFGLAVFVGVMFLMFQSIYAWANPLMELIDTGFTTFGNLVRPHLEAMPMVQSLVVDGMIGGVGSVVIFLPQIVILFIFIAVLEDSGYLARAAFLMDRLLGWTGLNGRAFIPMLSSYACAVPGIMATRVMPDLKARMTTILIAPLMSCSARLPVYMLFISAFIEPKYGPFWAAGALFGMHALGFIVALPVAWILNRGVLKTPSIPFILEMPPYRMPAPRNVFFRSYEAGKKFIVRAGTVIFAMSVLIWALSYFPRPASVAKDIESQFATRLEQAKSNLSKSNPSHAAQTDANKLVHRLERERHAQLESAYLEQSFLGRAGRFIHPIFKPLGFDWKISVGILSAFPAREVILTTLGIIYNVGDTVDENSADLKTKMAMEKRPDGSLLFTPLTAISLMVFFALCSQCMSTLVTVQRELNSTGWALFLFTYMTGLAYVMALIVYQTGRFLGFS